MPRTPVYLLALSLLSAPGCSLYFGDDDPCLYGGGLEDEPGAEPAPGQRNPVTGQCEYFGGGGGGCDPACGVCAQPADDEEPGALPSWGYCESRCSLLDEATCLVTPGCRGAYLDQIGFYECWAVDMSGPIQGGDCVGLEARDCSRHDDCIAIHASNCSDGSPGPDGDYACELRDFAACAAEPVGCYGDGECPADQRCTAGDICLQPPGCVLADDSGDLIDCEDVCYGFCVPAGAP